MEESLKQRLIGAVVLIGLGVIFIPMFLGDPEPQETFQEGSPIPPRPNRQTEAESSPLDPEYFSGLEKTKPPEQASSPQTPPVSKAEAPPSDQGQNSGVSAQPSVNEKTTPPPAAALSKEATAPASAKPSTPAVTVEKGKEPPAEKPLSVEEPPKPSPTGERVGVTAWAIQMGSFTSEENAKLLETKLRQRGYPAFVDKIYVKDAKVFRVRVGPELMESKAKELQAKIEQEISLKGIVVRYP